MILVGGLEVLELQDFSNVRGKGRNHFHQLLTPNDILISRAVLIAIDMNIDILARFIIPYYCDDENVKYQGSDNPFSSQTTYNILVHIVVAVSGSFLVLEKYVLLMVI